VVDGSNVIQEIVIVAQDGSQGSFLTAPVLNNFCQSARKVTLTARQNAYYTISPNAATTLTIPRNVTFNIAAPTQWGNGPMIYFSGRLTFAVEGTITSEDNLKSKLKVTDTVTVQRGSRTGKGPSSNASSDQGVNGSAFMGYVNGL
jgi:hypothetical protein